MSIESSLERSNFKVPREFVPDIDGFPNGNNRLVILGPPGCAKSTTLLNHYLVPALKTIDATKIFSCSYTVAAAKELRDRLGKLLSIEPSSLRSTCSTIHSESLRCFRKMPYAKEFKILGEKIDENGDSEGPLTRFREEFLISGKDNYSRTEKEIQTISLDAWEHARNRNITDYKTKQFAAHLVKFCVDYGKACKYIQQYEEYKKTNKLLDFTDILLNGLTTPCPERELVLLDEAQDCSPLQWSLLERWFDKSKKVVLCGDFDQTIHEWCGSDPAKIFDLLKKGYKSVGLGQSYRVPRKPFNLARRVILKNKDRIDFPFRPKTEEGSVLISTVKSAVDEIKNYTDQGKSAFLLIRAVSMFEKWEKELNESGVPYYNERGFSPFGSPTAIAVARAVMAIRDGNTINRDDAVRLIDALPGRNKDYFKKGTKKAETIDNLKCALIQFLTIKEYEDLGLETKALCDKELEELFKELGLKKREKALSEMIKKHGSSILDATPLLTVTTYHGSKGRGSDCVVVDTRLPMPAHKVVWNDEAAACSERRVFYVAITRVKDRLILVRTPKDYLTLCGLKNV